ncbi:phosphoribosylamine--glycine ligase [Actinomadura luteofluorescens]|uniref:Phosphoribosylamine--glycine ligase n=1 Tax=Actinomadura luteofluorescens TaxID=46163 RepID=A0A7Y9EHN7_9ACTN|nr:phosphoribosylamine--glycine ligase [Actinomadura luteofluorescens]NYD47966.1 phosphoribosylamine--glycine ligase [Actinomadura luteofluorescens]
MRVLVLGSGGREHALARALHRDPAVTALHCAPGNPGTAEIADNHQLDPTNRTAVVELAARLRVSLVVIGPEAVLVAGVGDALRKAGIPCFGPDRAAAKIEASKAFAKEVMAAAGVPTADSRVCESSGQAEEALDAFGPPYVVKDDGLAAGKGVVVTESREEALRHADACDRVVVEEYLDGPEVSLFALCDGQHAVALLPAQDFKRAYDGDEGPNTGGMGAYTPLPWAPPELVDEVMATVVQPTVDELRRRETPYVGVLYAGLALTSRGVRVVEFNARFGDPETQVVLDRLDTPVATLLQACAIGGLDPDLRLEWRPGAAVTVVVAAEGYPAAPAKGDEITGLEEAGAVEGAYVLHAGTALGGEGQPVASGGRVLNVVGTGPDLAAARAAAYEAVSRIGLRGSHHRTDIALKAISVP